MDLVDKEMESTRKDRVDKEIDLVDKEMDGPETRKANFSSKLWWSKLQKRHIGVSQEKSEFPCRDYQASQKT